MRLSMTLRVKEIKRPFLLSAVSCFNSKPALCCRGVQYLQRSQEVSLFPINDAEEMDTGCILIVCHDRDCRCRVFGKLEMCFEMFPRKNLIS